GRTANFSVFINCKKRSNLALPLGASRLFGDFSPSCASKVHSTPQIHGKIRILGVIEHELDSWGGFI
ncbi:hypothetical protein OAN72_00535, partial [bacterium]|nr:hypothetical protein [bacterium]